MTDSENKGREDLSMTGVAASGLLGGTPATAAAPVASLMSESQGELSRPMKLLIAWGLPIVGVLLVLAVWYSFHHH